MPITEAERKYLKNKHKGGKNNAKGNRYENFYAVFQIASLMNSQFERLDNVYLTSQLSETFVDDLLIEKDNSIRTYHQIKDVKKLTWKNKELRNDFKRQKDISKEREEQFNLKLVYSNIDFSESSPTDFSECTTTEYFPAFNELSQLYWNFEPFKNAITFISAEEKSGDDTLMGIACSILGVWESMNTEIPVSLKEISERVRKINGYDSLKIYPTIELSEESKRILDGIGVSFHTNGMTFYWSYGFFNGKIKWSKEIEQNLIEIAPTKIIDLISILS